MRKQSRLLLRSALLILGVAALTVLVSRLGAIAEQKPDGNADPITIQEAFVRSLGKARVPGGIVTKSDCGMQTKLQQDILALPLLESLNKITHTDPQYKWQDERGVINLIPTSGEPDVLKIRIREFRSENTSSVNLMLEQLLALPEIKSDSIGRRINQGLRFGGLSSPKSEQKLKIAIRDTTLREALNAIVRANGRAVWSYVESRCNEQEQFAIEFLVQ